MSEVDKFEPVHVIDIKSHTKGSGLRGWFRRQFALHGKRGDVLPLHELPSPVIATKYTQHTDGIK
jgi:hypothetical protein